MEEIRIFLIRHGRTPGNELKRYIGITDEALSAEGRAEILAGTYPAAERIVMSPMLRCRQTAALIYGEAAAREGRVIADLRECDFGRFENKNYLELAGDPQYQAWIDSGGKAAFPGGESPDGFRTRCCRAFLALADRLAEESRTDTALVVHGGTIMSIMAACARPRRDYYDWAVSNGGGYLAVIRPRDWKQTRTFSAWEELNKGETDI